MENRRTWFAFAIVAGLVFMASRALSQDGHDHDHQYGHADHAQKHEEGHGGMPEMSPEDAAKFAECMALGQPGEKHKALARFVGTWNTTTKIWMGGPGTPPTETTGRSVVKSILGGRYTMENFAGTVMGMPYEGMGLTGYDNYKNMYSVVWADSMGTAMFTALGQADPSGKNFTFYGQMDEPLLDVQDRMAKTVVRVINDGKHTFEMYDLHAGDNYKVMEIVYERVN